MSLKLVTVKKKQVSGIIIDSDWIFEEHINTLNVKMLAKNWMCYLEFHNIYHNTKSEFYSNLF